MTDYGLLTAQRIPIRRGEPRLRIDGNGYQDVGETAVAIVALRMDAMVLSVVLRIFEKSVRIR